MYQPKPVSWFIARIGQRIYGFLITDKMHADYLAAMAIGILVAIDYTVSLGLFAAFGLGVLIDIRDNTGDKK